MRLTFGSLFAGIGGLDLGFERAGFECLWQVEIDSYARSVLDRHWPDVRKHDDVRTWPSADTAFVDCLIGGFPCQDVSVAGKGVGIHGEKSSLFFEFMRIAGEMGPRYLVLENVSALLARGMGDVLGTMASLGYDAEWHCFGAAHVGAPHIRDRIFILGYRQRVVADSQSNGRDQGHQDAGGSEARDFQAEVAGSANGGRSAGVLADSNLPGLEEWSGICEYTGAELQATQRSHRKQGSDVEYAGGGRFAHSWTESEDSNTGPPGAPRGGIWSFEPRVGRVADGVPKRVDRIKCLGNAVVPQVGQFVAEVLLDRARRGF
jgi:DNA (cytosine-5)-methyltransferase 1